MVRVVALSELSEAWLRTSESGCWRIVRRFEHSVDIDDGVHALNVRSDRHDSPTGVLVDELPPRMAEGMVLTLGIQHPHMWRSRIRGGALLWVDGPDRGWQEVMARSWFATPHGRRFGGPVLREFFVVLREAVDAVRGGAGSRRENTVRALADAMVCTAGIGVGETPSTDDAMVGALAGAWRVLGDEARRLFIACDAAWYGSLLQRTTTTSAQLLRLATEGWYAESLVSLVEAAPDGVGGGLDVAVRHGHTSGADAVFGLWNAWAATAPLVCPSDSRKVNTCE